MCVYIYVSACYTPKIIPWPEWEYEQQHQHPTALTFRAAHKRHDLLWRKHQGLCCCEKILDLMEVYHTGRHNIHRYNL